MFGNNLNSKVNSNQLQTNILMTQIRAENKQFKCRHEPVYINSHRDENKVGKKIFKEQLYRTSFIFNH